MSKPPCGRKAGEALTTRFKAPPISAATAGPTAAGTRVHNHDGDATEAQPSRAVALVCIMEGNAKLRASAAVAQRPDIHEFLGSAVGPITRLAEPLRGQARRGRARRGRARRADTRRGLFGCSGVQVHELWEPDLPEIVVPKPFLAPAWPNG